MSVPAKPKGPVSLDRRLSFLFAAILLLLNAYISSGLFRAQFTVVLGSIESSFISYAAYASRNWGDLTWYPVWYSGTPFHNIYQPGFHLTVASLITLFHLTPQHAYHLLTGVVYSLGPVTLFCLCVSITKDHWYALAVGLMFSLISPIAILSRADGADVGGPFHPRRFQTLTEYGEAPHITAVMLMPLVILFLYRAAVDKKPLYFPAACVALAAIASTNWPGTVGLSMAVAAFCISEFGEKRMAWIRLAVIGAIAYLLASRWIPPSTVKLVFGDAQNSDGHHFQTEHLFYLAALILFFSAVHWGLRRAGTPPFLRFGIYFALLSGIVTLGRAWFAINLLPQANRFQIEMEMAVAISVCYLAKLLWARMPRRVGMVLGAILLVATVPLIKSNRRYARGLSAPLDMITTSEYKMARQFAKLRPNDRVFAPGNISFWMNLWTDTPQVSGCCDQGVPDQEHRIADFTIYSGQGAGDRDAEISLIWLRTYGATAVGADGPKSTEMYKPFVHPFKFDGVLPVLWRDGDDVIYDIPSRSRSLAHVIPRSAIITHAPENGLLFEPLQRYVTAIEDPAMPLAQFQWTSRHSAHISTSMQAGQVLALQVTYDPGWNATVNGEKRPTIRDKMGQMIVDAGCQGSCDVEMLYDGGTEARVVAGAQLLGLLLIIAAPFWLKKRSQNPLLPSTSEPRLAPGLH